MKWYPHNLHRMHQRDLKVLRDDPLEIYYPWVSQIANTFSRDAVAIGTLNMQDLLQAGYVGLVEAWNGLDHEKDQAQKWTYIKKRIKWAIRREIDKYGSFISRPINQIEDKRNNWEAADKILVNVFPSFFDEVLKIEDNYIESWANERLSEIIDDMLLKDIRDPKHRTIISLLFGLDCDKQSIKDVAKRFNMSEIGIKKVRERSLNKLNTEDNKKIIENFYEN